MVLVEYSSCPAASRRALPSAPFLFGILMLLPELWLTEPVCLSVCVMRSVGPGAR